MAENIAQTERFVRKKRLAQILGVSQTTIWRWVKEGKLPQGILLSKHCRVWRMSDVDEHIASIEFKAAQCLS